MGGQDRKRIETKKRKYTKETVEEREGGGYIDIGLCSVLLCVLETIVCAKSTAKTAFSQMTTVNMAGEKNTKRENKFNRQRKP